jgi:hypothetical protein
MLDLTNSSYRYDVVSVVVPPEPDHDVEIEVLRNFWSEDKFRKKRWE